MRIGIIGAGFTGLTAAYYLSKKGHEVTVLENLDEPGGLAIGFQDKRWKWSLEEHYHHWFTSDKYVQELALEIGSDILTVRPKTSTYTGGKTLQLDSPVSLLKFHQLPFFDRIRTGGVLFYLRKTSYWKPLERVTAKAFLTRYMGKKSWEVLWYPLFSKKFRGFEDTISMAWFWARIKSRTPSLMYPRGGFQSFASKLEESCKKKGATFFYQTRVQKIQKKKDMIQVSTTSKNYVFDRVICTLPSHLFASLAKGLPSPYLKKIKHLEGLGAMNLVLALKKPFFNDKTYWLNVNDIQIPFLALVEHTNFMKRKHYGNEYLLYIGNYLEQKHPYFALDENELFEEYLPYLKKIDPNFDKNSVRKKYLFKARFAQPIVPLNYSKKVLPLTTPIDGLYLANMQQVYPWDRGTNYAIELGKKVAEIVDSER